MNKQQAQVQQFHEAIQAKSDRPMVGMTPAMRHIKARRKLIREEFNELMDALFEGNFEEAIDAIMDLKYVLEGTLVEWGIDGEAFFDEVHRTNMEKVLGGRFDEHGKFLKPPGWKPPRIREMLMQLGVTPKQLTPTYAE